MKTYLLALCSFCILLSSTNIYGQKDCDKLVSVSVDEFSGDTSVTTDLWQIMGNSAAGLINAAIGDYLPEWLLYIGFEFQGKQAYVVFQHNSDMPSELNYAYIKFSDESVLKLEEHTAGDRHENALGENFKYTYFNINAEDLKIITEKDIVKMQASFQYQPRESNSTKEISKKTSLKVKRIAQCFAHKFSHLERVKPTLQEKNTIYNTQSINNTKSINNKIAPLGNDNTISIFKQWKTLTIINKEGIPISNKLEIFFQFFEDGTFKTTTIDSDGKIHEIKGKFQLLNNNKIIVLTYETGTTSSSAISKLTNTELELKTDEYTSISTVH